MAKNAKAKIKVVKKEKLPFGPKDFSKGAKKLHDGLKKLKGQWNDSDTSPKRRKEILDIYTNLSKEWTRFKKILKKHKL